MTGNRFQDDSLAPLTPDVVSVQSQVIYGRVGNKVAVPTFERAGWMALGVPTVLLSNTPHYASMHGGVVPEDWFGGWLDDLLARGCTGHVRLVQSGFMGSPAQAVKLADWIARLLAANPRLRVHVDPVIGDYDHGVYVDPALVPVYRDRLASMADVLTPNSFELAQLTDQAVDTVEHMTTAARGLLRGRTQAVIVTSALPNAWTAGEMAVAIVTADDATIIRHECVDDAPKGTGDFFSAILATHLLAGMDLDAAVRKAIDTVVEAVRRTQAARSVEMLFPWEDVPPS